MASSLAAAVSNFLQALTAIAASLVNSVLAVIQAIFALGAELLNGVLQLVQAFVAFGTDLFGSVLGFVAAHFVALLVLGGGYYLYTTRAQGGRSGSTKKLR